MKKYKINVDRTEYGFIEVNANNEKEAGELVEQEYENGNVNWGNEHLVFGKLEEVNLKYSSFIGDKEKMRDFFSMKKKAFLSFYDYLTEEEYDLTYNEVDNHNIRQITKEQAEQIINNEEPLGLFFVKDKGVYVGMDNSNGNAFTEEFSSHWECMLYLIGFSMEGGK